MFKKKTLFLLVAIVTIIVAIAAIVNISKRWGSNKLTPEGAIASINENVFDLEINTETKDAVVDGKNVRLSELLALPEKKIDEMISNNSLKDYLAQNLTGDIKVEGSAISVDNPYSTKTLIVKAEDKAELESSENVKLVEQIASKIYLVEYNNAIDTKNGYNQLQSNDSVENVMKDIKIHVSDVNFSSQSIGSENLAWGLSTTGLDNYRKKLEYKSTGNQVIVAVLDTGINPLHEAFKEKTSGDRLLMNEKAYDYMNHDEDPSDDSGHGTAVAGVIAQSTPTSVKILPVKVMDNEGKGNFSLVTKAITRLKDYADIFNLSMGVIPSEISEEEVQICEEFFKEIYENGNIVVCAAGNERGPVDYPGFSAYTLAASAVDSNNSFATSFSNSGEEVDFALPGVLLRVPKYDGNNTYDDMSGTSFSCPFLASAIANIKQENAELGLSGIVDILKENAVDLGDEGKDNYYGYGSINFNSGMFSKPVFAKLEASDKQWATSNQIVAKVVCANKIKTYAYQKGDGTPSSWYTIPTPTNAWEFEDTVTENGTYYFWVEDENDKITKSSFTVQYVDNADPVIAAYKKSGTTMNTITTALNVQDSDSGISEIKWYHKKSSEENYTEEAESLLNEGAGDTTSLTKNHVFSGLDENTEYNVYAKITDVVGNESETAKLNIRTTATQSTITIVNKTAGKAMVSVGGEESAQDFSAVTGEGKLFVSCGAPCWVILADDANETYSVISRAALVNGKHEFDFELGDLKFYIVLKGDVNMNGEVNVADTALINRSNLTDTMPAYSALTPLQKVVADINGNNTVNTADGMLINKSLLSKLHEAFKMLEW